MLKRSFSLLLCLIMVLGLAACTTTTTEGGGSEYYVVESYITTVQDGEDGGEASKDTAANKDSSKNSSTGKTSSSDKGSASSATSSGTASADKANKDRFDVGGAKEVKVLLWYTPEDWEQKIYDEFTKQTGAKVKFIPTGTSSVQQKLTALIAANDAPDVAIFESSDYPQFITKKLAQPLTKYIDKSKDTWLAYDLMDALKYNGEYYGITDHFWGGATFVYYNKDIFKNSTAVSKLKYETPLDAYNAGAWTWDTFYDFAEALTVKDAKGNVTQWGAKTSAVDNFIRSTGSAVISIVDGKATNTINTKGLKDACAFVQKLYKNNVYTKDQGSWDQGNVAMNIMPQYPIRTDNYPSWADIKFEWDWVPFPKYPDGKSYQPVGIQVGSVPRKAKNPDAGYALINFRAYYQESMRTITQSNKDWVARYKKAVTGDTSFAMEVGIIGNEVWTLYAELTDPANSLQSKIDSWSSVVDGKIKSFEQEASDFNF